MKQRLRYLPLNELLEGMVLGASLTIAEHGVTNFALPAGHVLTEDNLCQIARRGGEFACIAEEDPRSDEDRAAEQAANAAQLQRIFANADMERPAVAGLYAAVLAYRSL